MVSRTQAWQRRWLQYTSLWGLRSVISDFLLFLMIMHDIAKPLMCTTYNAPHQIHHWDLATIHRWLVTYQCLRVAWDAPAWAGENPEKRKKKKLAKSRKVVKTIWKTNKISSQGLMVFDCPMIVTAFLFWACFFCFFFRILSSSGGSQADSQALAEDWLELATMAADWPTLASPPPVAGCLLDSGRLQW